MFLAGLLRAAEI